MILNSSRVSPDALKENFIVNERTLCCCNISSWSWKQTFYGLSETTAASVIRERSVDSTQNNKYKHFSFIEDLPIKRWLLASTSFRHFQVLSSNTKWKWKFPLLLYSVRMLFGRSVSLLVFTTQFCSQLYLVPFFLM